jgi:hypothetical protein
VSFFQNYQFCLGQQPKPQIGLLCVFWSLLLPDADDSTTNAGPVQAQFSPRHILKRQQRTAGMKDACKLARAAFTVDIAGPTWLSSLDVRLLHDQACA